MHVTFETIEKKTRIHTRSDLKHKKKWFLRKKAINRFKFTAISNMNNIFKLQNDYLADLKNWKIGEVNIALTALNEIKRGEKKE